MPSGGALAQCAHALIGIAANLSARELRFWAAALSGRRSVAICSARRPIVTRVRAEFERCVDAVPALLARFSEARERRCARESPTFARGAART